MSVGDSLRKNLQFWHWYPRLLCEDLSEEQLHWQPENHPNHMMFAMWHAYRSEDEIVHGLLMRRPSVFVRDGWASRLPVAEPGNPPFGTGLNREQIGRPSAYRRPSRIRRSGCGFATGVCGWPERCGGRGADPTSALRTHLSDA